MIGVYDKQPAGIKFVKIHTKHLEGKFCVLLFMDNKASDLEIKEGYSHLRRPMRRVAWIVISYGAFVFINE